jgi:hypothetical protein
MSLAIGMSSGLREAALMVCSAAAIVGGDDEDIEVEMRLIVRNRKILSN